MKLEKMNLKEIEEYLSIQEKIDDFIINKLQKDKRVGVKKLLNKYQKKLEKIKQEKLLLEKLLFYEKELLKQSIQPIAGIDEAGRGPLAGPIFAAAVILPTEHNIIGLKDSKKLSKCKREELFEEIKEKSLSWSIGYCSAKVIDHFNILEATKMAMVKAVSTLKRKPAYLLIDAVKLDLLSIPQLSLIKGEDKSASIAAASIVAKVLRDRYMTEIAKKYPQYKFEIHKGYPTKEHYKCIKRYGPSPEHRLTFKGVLY